MLSFDTCLDKTYVTLFDGEKFNNKIILSNDGNYHSAYLISTIVEILKEASMTPEDLDCISIDIGPGSFTGIRACTTVARMLAQQLNIKAVGISSLEILSKILGGNDLVALDARKNKAYVYDGKVLGAIELEEVDEMVKNRRLITDNSLFDRFSALTDDIVSYQQNEYQLGEILAKLALEKIKEGENTDWRNLKPLYIQPPPVFGR
ncbi:MAG: tRNA (adenosine(37)-N6)-threonylcarbamoyltransferase complex dimerization subunit type 1 TsaB [Candidatus Gastranaerophilales bacterium]|nr:tRNA (adenosine(37)-N6)-threonylcarbamoyltransferase complex dimerization subunit type 1 TsaB [Candidatus Gastranaerophilales bacterium]MCM1072672.1 tRNA (adenosine(37)-N6)-threonylcarbamoyltransferase complex dimerization subunit type 1 TsaB [Bacteroides sp.]